MITDALQEVGAARSIVIDEEGTILAGNATVEAAARAGIEKVLVVDVDGRTLVAVRRRDLAPEQKVKLSVYDNRAAELAEWDPAVLARLQQEFPDFDIHAFWDAREFDQVMEGLGESAPGFTDPDAIPPLRGTDIMPGDVFRLGAHRLLCGDSTNPAHVAALFAGAVPFLMVTDPPYGVEYDPTWRNRAGVSESLRTGAVANDDRADWSDAWRLFPGDVAYVWHAGIYSSVVESSLVATGFEPRAQIIWRKPRFVLSRGHYHWQHEPCWYAVRRGAAAKWTGRRNQSTVWNLATFLRCNHCGAVLAEAADVSASTVWDIEHADETGVTRHGTQKPVECMERPLRNHGGRGDAVYEPFSGSGSTLIAAERQRRACFAIELTPGYVQMAIDRWEHYTGQKA
ncbi:MAG TPA: DNA methyltransferase [Vicinamibacterales bacterium]|nr:DNA methyltransferase [Vicinamibacterales bacterium]